jgi:hypothetical protein
MKTVGATKKIAGLSDSENLNIYSYFPSGRDQLQRIAPKVYRTAKP